MFRSFLPVVVVIFLAIGQSTPALAQLRWERSLIEREAKVGDTEIEIAFPFTNGGTSSITILSVQPGCDCTTANLKKKTYAAGESGEIRAHFKFEQRVGLQEKVLTIVTDDAPQAAKTLMFRVKIPEIITVKPPVFHWRVGQAPEMKEGLVTTESDINVTLTAVESSDASFTAKIATEATGKRFRLQVTPKSTTTTSNATITVHFEVVPGRRESRTVFALVQ